MASAAEVGQFPPSGLPEVAFLGRSNVGKSSVINSLLQDKVARTSSTPGRTRAINFFALRQRGAAAPQLIFADLPGYGYAKLPKEMTAEWPKFIDPYLKDRPTLALCVCLVDMSVPRQERDRQLLEFVQYAGRDFLVVGTKADRVSSSRLRTTQAELQKQLQVDRLLPYSSKTGLGRDDLWKEIYSATQRVASQGEQVVGS